MSRSSLAMVSLDLRFPRVSGDEPAYMIDTNTNAEFSPRERG